MTTHVLVFGGTGRLGPQVVQTLAGRNTLSIFTRRSDPPKGVPSGQVIRCDLASDEYTQRAVTQVIAEHASRASRLGILHMATRGLIADSAGDLHGEYAIAVEGFDAIIRAVHESGQVWDSVSAVFTSSMAVKTLPPGSLGYAVAKAAGESFCAYMARHPPSPNWRFNVLRVGRVSRAANLGASVGKLADFLISEDSEDISGQVFTATSPQLEESSA